MNTNEQWYESENEKQSISLTSYQKQVHNRIRDIIIANEWKTVSQALNHKYRTSKMSRFCYKYRKIIFLCLILFASTNQVNTPRLQYIKVSIIEWMNE
jgi:hypothetical protein